MLIDGARSLAHIERIEWIKEINGADNIEMVGVLGWTLIAKRGEFSVGDKCVYIEIDSLCPETNPTFAFLATKRYKVKTMKIGKFGVISQGLALPISSFKEDVDKPIGSDVTKILGIKYYVADDNTRKGVDADQKYKSMAARHPVIFKKKVIRIMMKSAFWKNVLYLFFGKRKDKPLAFPTKFAFIHKTDEERVENMPWVLGYKNPLVVTEKLDGTSSTYILERKGKHKYEFYVLSRNVRQKTPDQKCYHDGNIYWENAFRYDIEKHMKEFMESNKLLSYICIQGESVGAVQGNPLKLKENDLYVFNFITSDDGRLDSVTGSAIIESWGMKWVPIIDTNYRMPTGMDEFKRFATAKSAVNGSVLREGVVLRDPRTDLSFKNVSREYLLKHSV